MENTLEKNIWFEQYVKLDKEGYTAHDYQTSQFVQALIPFLQEVQSKIIRYESRIEYLENRVNQLDSLI